MPEFDVVGVGLNATDTLLIVPHFPAYAGKVPFEEEHLSPGGQVASALVACARLATCAGCAGLALCACGRAAAAVKASATPTADR